MSARGRSTSPRPLQDADVDMENGGGSTKPNAKVVIVTNLSRNVVEAHLQTIFGFYGQITKIDLPIFGKSGQNRGKAALEYADSTSAHKAASHMDGGQIDGAILKVELSDLPVRSRSRSPRRGPRNGRDRNRSFSRSRTRSRSPPPYRRRGYEPRRGEGYRGRGFGRRGPPPREEIVCHQEGAPQAMNVVGLVTGEEGVDLDREAIQCAQAVHAHGPPRDPVRDQGRIHLIRDIVAGVVRGHLVEEGGASVTSGIVGPGLLRDLISWFAQNIVYVTHGRMHAPEYIS